MKRPICFLIIFSCLNFSLALAQEHIEKAGTVEIIPWDSNGISDAEAPHDSTDDYNELPVQQQYNINININQNLQRGGYAPYYPYIYPRRRRPHSIDKPKTFPGKNVMPKR